MSRGAEYFQRGPNSLEIFDLVGPNISWQIVWCSWWCLFSHFMLRKNVSIYINGGRNGSAKREWHWGGLYVAMYVHICVSFCCEFSVMWPCDMYRMDWGGVCACVVCSMWHLYTANGALSQMCQIPPLLNLPAFIANCLPPFISIFLTRWPMNYWGSFTDPIPETYSCSLPSCYH